MAQAKARSAGITAILVERQRITIRAVEFALSAIIALWLGWQVAIMFATEVAHALVSAP